MDKKLSDKDEVVVEYIKLNPSLSSKEIHTGLAESISYSTIKRIILKLITANLVMVSGQGKGTGKVLGKVRGKEQAAEKGRAIRLLRL